jgi:nucleoside-diphosphate-sugar epimerase
MNIAVTGGSGRLGQVVVKQLAGSGHQVLSLDRVVPSAAQHLQIDQKTPRFAEVDLNNLAALTETITGCDALIHLAAFPGPWGQAPGVVYANNTLISYNVLYASSSLGMRYVCLASSINAVGGLGSRRGHFDYFPVDEKHPSYSEDDYSLSKWVMEQQADSFANRFPEMTISSLRFHALVPAPPERQHTLETAESGSARGLWGWTLIEEGARACVLALQAEFRGHEVFFITAPRTTSAIPTVELAAHAFPGIPFRKELPGTTSFYDASKAARLLGWVHANV